MSDLHEFIALWENRSKDGKVYLSGRLGNSRVVFFRNDHKQKESQPDWRGYTAPKQKEDSHNARNNNDEWDL